MKIGLLCAMPSEAEALLPSLTVRERAICGGTTVYECACAALPVVLAVTGVGKVNAAITAQLLIDRYAVTHMLMAGVAGGIDARLGLHALAFSERLAQHDIDPDMLRRRPSPEDGYFPGDPALLRLCRALDAQGAFLYPAFFGTMVSGEQFIDQEGRQEIIARWRPLCVDMESAAAAHACFASGIPFLAIRAMSDTGAQSGADVFAAHEVSAAQAASSAAVAVLGALARQGA